MDSFETIAEIAIALTGFTGIVTVLRERGVDAWTAEEVFRLKALLWWSLGTMFLAFVPSALALLWKGEPVSWRVAHGIFAAFHASVFYWFYRQVGSLPAGLTAQAWLIVAVGFGVLGLELTVALGYFVGEGAFLYLVALLWFLFLAAGSFAYLLFPQGDGRS